MERGLRTPFKTSKFMIRFLKNQDIIKKKWDDCIAFSVNERAYAYSWYLDIVAPEWSALVLDDYQAVFPVVHQKKMGIDYAFQPFFTQQLGLFTPLLLSPELLHSFLDKLMEIFPFIQMNLNIHNQPDASKIQFQLKKNYELDLISPYPFLKKEYSKNTKRNLKKAQKAGLTVFKNLKPELVGELFKQNKGSKLKVYSTEDYKRLNRLAYKAIEKGRAQVWGVYSKHNSLLAAAIFLKDNRRFTFLFSGLNEEGRENGAMVYLLDAFIEAYAEHKMILDFEGSMDSNLARFYKSFGAQLIHYPHIYYNNLPFYINASLYLKNLFKKKPAF